MTDLCDSLAEWSLARDWSRISASARQMAQSLLLDTLGCALGGRRHVVAGQVGTVARSLTGPPVATGLGSGRRLSLLAAILDSGTAIRALDLNDFYWGAGSGGHPSDIFAVAIAVAEETGASVDAMLTAVVAGYEVYTRLLDLNRSGDPPWPWDHTTACGLSAAIICGCLYGLDRERFAEALAIAAARSPTLSALRAGRISSVKAVAPALVQIDATLAVQLAAAGVTGPRGEIAGPHGLQVVVVPGADLGDLIPSADARERVLDIMIKRFPCTGMSQASTAAALELHQRLGGRVEHVRMLTVRLADSEIVRRQTADIYRRPDRRETADHSFYALCAMALLDGRLEDAQFEAARWQDHDVQAVIDILTLVPDLPGAEAGIFSAIATATLDNGEEIVVEMPYAPGHRMNPLSEAALADKVRSLAEPAIGRDRSEQLIAACLAPIEGVAVRDLVAPLRGDS